MGLTRRLAAVVAAVAAVLAGACDGSASGVEVPDGFVEAGVDGAARFAHPARWKVVEPSSEEVALQVEAPGGGTDGLPTTGIQLFHTDLERNVEIEAWVSYQLSELRVGTSGLRVTSRRDAEVAGAAAAKLLEATFETADGGVPIEAYQLFALDGRRHAVILVVSGTDVDRDLALRIIGTVRLDT